MYSVGSPPGEFVKANAVKAETRQEVAPFYGLFGLHKGEIAANIGSPKSNGGSVFKLQPIAVDLYKPMFSCRLVEPVGHIGKGLRRIFGGRKDKPVVLRLSRQGPCNQKAEPKGEGEPLYRLLEPKEGERAFSGHRGRCREA